MQYTKRVLKNPSFQYIPCFSYNWSYEAYGFQSSIQEVPPLDILNDFRGKRPSGFPKLLEEFLGFNMTSYHWGKP